MDIKYFYILLMFMVSFISIYNTEAIGFGLLFAVQTLFTIVLIIDIFQDLSRSSKSLIIEFTNNNVSIPFYLVLLPGIILQFAASLMTMMYSNYLQKKYNRVKLNRDLRWDMDRYKWMFIVVTLALLGLTYSYTSDFNNNESFTRFAGSYKSLLIVFFAISAVFPIINVTNASKLSKIMVTSTE